MLKCKLLALIGLCNPHAPPPVANPSVAVVAPERAPVATILPIRNPHPLVSFDIYVRGQDGVLVRPPPMKRGEAHMNDAGVLMLPVDGVDHVHLVLVTYQASGIENSNIDIEDALRAAPTLTDQQKKALAWLQTNTVELADGAVVWHYTFDHSFNEVRVKGGWPSAFGQADAIKALIMAYRRTGSNDYIELARAAAKAYRIPCEQGGLRCVVGGVPWFEELPLPYGYAPMILNGHLYSLVILHKLWEETKDPEIKASFDEGVASARRLLYRFDTGYWTDYQLRPRTMNLLVVLRAAIADTTIREISARSAFSEPSSIKLVGKIEKTLPGSYAWKGIDPPTDGGAKLTGLGLVGLELPRMTIDHDPVDFKGFDIAVRFRSPDCAPPLIGTYDWRAGTQDYMAIPGVKSERAGDDCLATATISTRLNQWSQVDGFYHQWHQRLMTEMWRMTGDKAFYATAVRWGRYAEEQKRHADAKTVDEILQPVFDPQPSEADDAAINEALEGADPASLKGEGVAAAIRKWAISRELDASRTKALLARAGLRG